MAKLSIGSGPLVRRAANTRRTGNLGRRTSMAGSRSMSIGPGRTLMRGPNPGLVGSSINSSTGRSINPYVSPPAFAFLARAGESGGPPWTAPLGAVLTTSLTGTNNDLVYTAAFRGASSNGVSVEYVDPAGNDQELAVSVDELAISVSLATDEEGAITSTAADVATAIAAEPAAARLVTIEDAAGNDGSGVVTVLAATPLAGGAGPTVPA